MALAEYFERNAQAAAHVISRFDRESFVALVGQLEVGVAFGQDVVETKEGDAQLDLLVRLLSRFYPRLQIDGPSGPRLDRAIELALSVNPLIDLSKGRRPVTGVVLGVDARPYRRTVYSGSDAWTGSVGTRHPLPIGHSPIPFGPGVAACVAASNVFRLLVTRRGGRDVESSLSAWTMSPEGAGVGASANDKASFPKGTVVVGAGAIGNAAAWALGRLEDIGEVIVVDPEVVELSNLQRYVLMSRDSEGQQKAPLVAEFFKGTLGASPFVGTWRQFVESYGYASTAALLALDTARDRREVQGTLPRWIANAWTQPGDLGISVHSPFGGIGACVACMYMPSGRVPNEDEVYARALGMPQMVNEIRTMLHLDAPLTQAFLDAVAIGLDQPSELLRPFEGRSIRDLYVEGVCGGAVLPLGSARNVRQEIHVPLAHQSALAGVLLAASLARFARGKELAITEVTQIDVLRPLAVLPTRAVLASPACVCRDSDFVTTYKRKTWSDADLRSAPAKMSGRHFERSQG